MGKTLVEHCAVIEDPGLGRVAHDLTEMLVIVTCAMFSEVEIFLDIAEWARHKEAWLRRFLCLDNGLQILSRPESQASSIACPTSRKSGKSAMCLRTSA